MISDQRILCIVPARAGSKGLPGKNIRPLAGKPLLAWPIAAARGSAYVDRVIISTDSQAFADIAVAHGADCPFLRPAELASDTAPSLDFILHAIDTLAADGEHYDILLLLEPTSPLTEASDVDAALEQLVASDASAVVGISAMETQHPAFSVLKDDRGLIRPAQSADFANLPRRQDLDPVFALDGSLYISTIDALRKERGFCHSNTLGYVTERHKAFEVDDLVDFIAIEAILKHLPDIRADAQRKQEPTP
jgi:N-acylneuraminate cytidylyltransferase/CMP-N,N'-diacetyllegionaminic acid synthase